MKIIAEQLILLFMFMIVGYCIGKSGLIQREHSKILSTLEIYVFLPSTIFNAFYKNFTVSNLTLYYPLIITATVILGVLICLSYSLSGFFAKDGYEKSILKYTLIIPNYGYMGYALAEGLFGAQGLLDIILFAIPFAIYTYTFGFCLLTKRKVSLKSLINPVLISILVGAVFGIGNMKLPGVGEVFINKAAACMAPVSMLLAGITISEFKIKELVTDKKVYIISLIRLVVIPVGVMFVLKLFASDSVVGTAVLLCAMPCGLNTIVFPKLIGEDCKMGAKLAFVSNIFALISIPIILNFI